MAYRDKEPNRYLEVIILTLLLGAVISPIARCVGRTAGEAQNQYRSPVQQFAQPDFSRVKVLVSRQQADGVTEADFSLPFLSALENWSVERTKANAKKYWDAASVPEDQRSLKGESVYMESGKHKLAVVRIRTGQTTPNATIVGIVGTELIKIGCFDEAGGDVPITSGPCDAKIQEIFGDASDPLEAAVG